WQADYRRWRPPVERAVAWLVHHGNRKLRYRGTGDRLGQPGDRTLERNPVRGGARTWSRRSSWLMMRADPVSAAIPIVMR
ncbi:hypothetical protein, partial [Streptomyces sp. NPDC005969]|uniref:hypothetical protein n=1 Tax=Streptomyces sp. NPDC005969 TaxID=3156722 RepID=UPI0033BFFF50